MSISGISSSNFFQSLYGQNTQRAQFAQQFQQLGQDLQSGNLSQAQSDFATLTANSPFAQQAVQGAASPTTSINNAAAATTPSPNASPIAQAFTQLSQDLQAGNLTAAQSDYATIQQDFQQQAAAVGNHPHHHHHHASANSASNNQNLTASPTATTTGNTATSANPGGTPSATGTTATTGSTNSLDQTILQLSQALQTGNLATAQQSYTSLLQEFQQSGALGANNTTTPSLEGRLVSATSTTQLLNLTV